MSDAQGPEQIYLASSAAVSYYLDVIQRSKKSNNRPPCDNTTLVPHSATISSLASAAVSYVSMPCLSMQGGIYHKKIGGLDTH